MKITISNCWWLNRNPTAADALVRNSPSAQHRSLWLPPASLNFQKIPAPHCPQHFSITIFTFLPILSQYYLSLKYIWDLFLSAQLPEVTMCVKSCTQGEHKSLKKPLKYCFTFKTRANTCTWTVRALAVLKDNAVGLMRPYWKHKHSQMPVQ